ncbi:hypothetical protein ACFYWH_34300 [Streptomyces sp. NPDC003737]|uniref:hypothetical protein n=1 Tax=Streptomyces sp. NPDC003737 TaxID=3364685 RepID=UPI00368BBE93
MNDLHTEEDVRGSLGLCLDPGRGVERAPLQLTKVMPQALRDAVEQYVPHLAELREAAELQEEQGRMGRQRYADELAAFIHGDEAGTTRLPHPRSPTRTDSVQQ